VTATLVAAVQAHPAKDLDAGLERTATLAADAAGRGATLVAFPETWLPGYPAWLDVSEGAALWDNTVVKAAYRAMAEQSVSMTGPAANRLAEIAADHHITLVIGVVERVDAGPGRGTLYNTLLFWGPDGRLLNHHRKLMPTYTERMVWGQGDGDGVRAVDSAAGRIGGLICWEHWMPLARQALHEDGEDIHIAVWPTVRETSLLASRHYAFEGRCFVLAVGSLLRAAALPAGLPAADSSEWVVRGGSAIIAPDASVIAGPVFDRECTLIAECDLGRVREESMTLDVAGHYSRPDCFRLERTSHGRALAAGPARTHLPA